MTDGHVTGSWVGSTQMTRQSPARSLPITTCVARRCFLLRRITYAPSSITSYRCHREQRQRRRLHQHRRGPPERRRPRLPGLAGRRHRSGAAALGVILAAYPTPLGWTDRLAGWLGDGTPWTVEGMPTYPDRSAIRAARRVAFDAANRAIEDWLIGEWQALAAGRVLTASPETVVADDSPPPVEATRKTPLGERKRRNATGGKEIVGTSTSPQPA